MAGKQSKPDGGLVSARLVLLAVLVIVAAVYAQVLGGPFVWDDRALILRDPLVRLLHPVGAYFAHGFWRSSAAGAAPRGYYRPLTTLSYALDYALSGPNPGAFHLTNLLFHLINVAFVFVLARRRARPIVAGFIATAWGLLPRLTESVAWISGRTDVLATAFVLGGLCVFDVKAPSRRWIAALCFAVGLACKETALAGLAAVVVLDAASGARSARTWARRLAPFAVCALPYAVLRACSSNLTASTALALGAIGRVETVFEAVGRYAFMIALPWTPRTQIGLLGHPTWAFIVAGVAVAVAIGVALARARSRLAAEDAAMLALGGAALLPVLHLLPLPVNVVSADRFLYLPMAGLALAASHFLDGWARRAPRVAASGAILLLASFAVAAHLRALDWTDEPRLWAKAVERTRRDNVLPLFELSNVYYRAALFDDAQQGYRTGLDRLRAEGRLPSPERSVLLENLATALAEQGHYAHALSLRVALVRANPKRPTTQLHYALSELQVLHFSQARAHALRALHLFPGYEQARDLLAELPRLEDETRRLGPLPVSHPSRLATAKLARYATLEMDLGRRADAERLWQQVVARADAPPGALREASVFLVQWGSVSAAKRAVARWARLAPAAQSLPAVRLVLSARARTVHELESLRGLLTR